METGGRPIQGRYPTAAAVARISLFDPLGGGTSSADSRTDWGWTAVSKGGERVSLFGDPRYQYRDTYFVLFPQTHRPTEDQVLQLLAQLGPRFNAGESRYINGFLESITLFAPSDASAIDIAYVEGEDVTSQVKEIRNEFRSITVREGDLDNLRKIRDFDARLDVFHFEKLHNGGEDDELFDPGGLLLTLEALTTLCQGVGYDPQSQSLL